MGHVSDSEAQVPSRAFEVLEAEPECTFEDLTFLSESDPALTFEPAPARP